MRLAPSRSAREFLTKHRKPAFGLNARGFVLNDIPVFG